METKNHLKFIKSDLIIETCEPTVSCYKAVKKNNKLKQNFPNYGFVLQPINFLDLEVINLLNDMRVVRKPLKAHKNL